MNTYNWLLTLAVLFPLISHADSLELHGAPGLMTVNSATAGSNPDTVQNTSTTYSGTSTGGTTITGSVSPAMPSGVTLQIQFPAPSGAVSQGLVTMTPTAQNLVTGIDSGTQWSMLTITYQLSATAAATAQSNVSRIVTYTFQ